LYDAEDEIDGNRRERVIPREALACLIRVTAILTSRFSFIADSTRLTSMGSLKFVHHRVNETAFETDIKTFVVTAFVVDVQDCGTFAFACGDLKSGPTLQPHKRIPANIMNKKKHPLLVK